MIGTPTTMITKDLDRGSEFSQQVDIEKYLPPDELLANYPQPGPVEQDRGARFTKDNPGSTYVLTYSHIVGGLIMVPPHHPLNSNPKEDPGADYGQTVFEGLSLEPFSSDTANLVLWNPRVARMGRSVKAHDFEIPLGLDEFVQGIKDLTSVVGPDYLNLNGGNPSRAYIRPVIKRGPGPYAIAPTPGSNVEMTVLCWNWPHYLPKEDYVEGVPVVAFLDAQRRDPIRAKEAGNYSRGKELKERCRNLGGHEVLFIAPFINGGEDGLVQINDLDVVSPNEMVKRAYLADGLGEELGIIQGGTLIYPPRLVNRLGGTTLDYCVNYLAPKLGLKTEESLFGFSDLEEEGTALLMFGNAAKVAPVKSIVVASETNQVVRKIDMTINEEARRMVNTFEEEVSGKVEPSHSSLLTPVKFDPKARQILDSKFKNWI